MNEVVPTIVDIAVLLPKITDWERTMTRYGGLAKQLLEHDVSMVFAESHASYCGEGTFMGTLTPINPELGSCSSLQSNGNVKSTLVRDLTMPSEPMPLYTDVLAPYLVHQPSVNDLLQSKSRVYDLMHHVQPFSIGHVNTIDIKEAVASIPGDKVVIKPDTGLAGKDVYIGTKSEAVNAYLANPHDGLSIVQEAIDMTKGLEEHNLEGVHNVRFIAIGGSAIFGFVRSDPSGSLTMQGETFKKRNFMLPEDFRTSLLSVLLTSQEKFASIPYGAETVIAYDLIRGTDHTGEMREFLLEINRRPLRNSPYDGRDQQTLWAAHKWDDAEAKMLATIKQTVSL